MRIKSSKEPCKDDLNPNFIKGWHLLETGDATAAQDSYFFSR